MRQPSELLVTGLAQLFQEVLDAQEGVELASWYKRPSIQERASMASRVILHVFVAPHLAADWVGHAGLGGADVDGFELAIGMVAGDSDEQVLARRHQVELDLAGSSRGRGPGSHFRWSACLGQSRRPWVHVAEERRRGLRARGCAPAPWRGRGRCSRR